MIERLNSGLQLAASIGILLGLLLVGVQIQQATDIASAQMQAASFDSTIQANDIVIGEGFAQSWAKARKNSEELTEVDHVVVQAFLTREWLNNVRTERSRKAGFGDESWDSTVSVDKWVFGYLGNETALRWWRSRSESLKSMAPELDRRIDIALEAQGDKHHLFHIRQIQHRASVPMYSQKVHEN